MSKTKVHRIVLLVVDDDDLGAAEIGRIIERERYPNHCISPQVIDSDTREVEWSDDHPLNDERTREQAVEDLFGLAEDYKGEDR